MIRASKIDDAPTITNLVRTAYPEREPFDTYTQIDDWERFIEEQLSYVFEQDGIIVGHGGISLEPSITLCRSFVHPHSRENGIYTQLLDHRLSQYSPETLIESFVVPTTPKPQQALLRRGFMPVGILLNAYNTSHGHDGSLVHMVRGEYTGERYPHDIPGLITPVRRLLGLEA